MSSKRSTSRGRYLDKADEQKEDRLPAPRLQRKREWDPATIISPERGPGLKKEIKRERSPLSKRSLTSSYSENRRSTRSRCNEDQKKTKQMSDEDFKKATVKSGIKVKQEPDAVVKEEIDPIVTEQSDEPIRKHSSREHASSTSSDMEDDPQVLSRRQKQIDYGKNTIAYDNYIKAIPKNERKREHPQTPNKYKKYSRRAWDGCIKVWRKQLHVFDPNGEQEGEASKPESTVNDEEEFLPFDFIDDDVDD